jgi:hypothetical protein
MQTPCLACNCSITYPLYHPEPQPLAALNLPRTHEAAASAIRFPENWHVCAHCGHIFNVEFDYYRIPYEDNSNLMYNRGSLWLEHMGVLADQLLGEFGAAGKTVIDIGCGDGLFFKLLRDRNPQCRCIGFEPGIEAENARKTGAEVFKDYFIPQRDLKRIRADFLVCRHVIEHMANPREFVASIAYWCSRYEQYPVFLAEVPQIDKAVTQGRVTDFLYEHVSNFTAESFRMLFATTGFEVLDLASCYGGEVAVAWVRPSRNPRISSVIASTDRFRRSIETQIRQVRGQLQELRAAGQSVAFWGGTGKGAAFLNAFDIRAAEYPVVIDSDPNKLGRFVPGMAQELRSPEYLLDHPVDVIVITTRWRAKDICNEIVRRGIRFKQVLVLEGEQLQLYEPAKEMLDERQVPSKQEERSSQVVHRRDHRHVDDGRRQPLGHLPALPIVAAPWNDGASAPAES